MEPIIFHIFIIKVIKSKTCIFRFSRKTSLSTCTGNVDAFPVLCILMMYCACTCYNSVGLWSYYNYIIFNRVGKIVG